MRRVAIVAVITGSVLGAAPPQMQPRRLWDVQLLERAAKNRQPAEARKPAKDGPVPSTEPQAVKEPAYISGQPLAQPFLEQDSLVGITIWRLRPSEPGDSAVLVEPDAGASWTPLRVRPGDLLAQGDLVRIAIEAPRSGYLYVINRELYADGSESAPFLIFPTRRVRFGNSQVEPGRLIEIPDQADTPPYFRLVPRDKRYRGEKLTVILTPEPLPGITLGRSYVELSSDRVREWEANWAGVVEQFELQAPPGALWTLAEQMAGIGSRLLIQEEPMPQTIYRVTTSADSPLLVEVPLHVGEAGSNP